MAYPVLALRPFAPFLHFGAVVGSCVRGCQGVYGISILPVLWLRSSCSLRLFFIPLFNKTAFLWHYSSFEYFLFPLFHFNIFVSSWVSEVAKGYLHVGVSPLFNFLPCLGLRQFSSGSLCCIWARRHSYLFLEAPSAGGLLQSLRYPVEPLCTRLPRGVWMGGFIVPSYFETLP